MTSRRGTISIRVYILLISLSVLTGSWFVSAQPAQVTLTTLPPMTARPGEFVTLVFTFDNPTATSETFDLLLDLPNGFAIVTGAAEVTVEAQNEALVFLTVFVPQDAPVGEAAVKLEAVSRSDPTARLEAVAVVRVVAVSQLAVVALPDPRASEAGVAVVFVVSNRGNAETGVSFEASSQSGFPLSVKPAQATLAPGAQVEVVVEVALPPNVGAVQPNDRVRLTAQSTLDPEQFAEAVSEIELLPPPPQAIATGLGQRLPSSLTLALSRTSEADGFGAIATLAAAGEVLGVEVGAQVAVDNAPSIRSSRLSLATGLLEVSFGDVAGAFDSFTRLAGRGARVTLGPRAAPISNISLVGIRSQNLMAGALNATLGLEALGLSVSALLRRLEHDVESQASARMALNFASSMLGVEAAFTQTADVWDTALSADTTFAQGPLSLSLALFRAGPDFNGGGRNQTHVTLNHQLSFEHLVLDARLRAGVDRLRPNPPLPSVGFSDLRLVANAFLGMGLPSISGAFRQQTSKDVGIPPALDTLSQSLTLSARQPLPFASVALTLGIERTLDTIANEDTGSVEVGALLGWNAQGVSRTLGVSNTVGVDYGAGILLGQTLELSSTLGLSTPLGALALRLKNVRPLTTIVASLSGGGAATTLSLSTEFQLTDAELTAFSARLSFSRRFETPLPFVPINGQIEGVVFVDANRNRRFDSGEALAGVVLIGGGARAVSDGEGFFRLPPLPPGNYLINLERSVSGLVPAVELPLTVSLEAGQRLRVVVPLVPVASIEGMVFNDENENGALDNGESGLAGIAVVLVNESGAEADRALTTAGGRFSFVELDPGAYTVRLDPASFPPRFEPTTASSLSVTLAPQEQVNLFFGLREVPPEVRVTASAPLAAFSFSPANPVAGEAVSFEASESFDLDGEIVLYQWDFESDGVPDAEGQQVSFAFAAPGEFEVTLTVTDNEGLTGQIKKSIVVLAP